MSFWKLFNCNFYFVNVLLVVEILHFKWWRFLLFLLVDFSLVFLPVHWNCSGTCFTWCIQACNCIHTHNVLIYCTHVHVYMYINNPFPACVHVHVHVHSGERFPIATCTCTIVHTCTCNRHVIIMLHCKKNIYKCTLCWRIDSYM